MTESCSYCDLCVTHITSITIYNFKRVSSSHVLVTFMKTFQDSSISNDFSVIFVRVFGKTDLTTSSQKNYAGLEKNKKISHMTAIPSIHISLICGKAGANLSQSQQPFTRLLEQPVTLLHN